MDAFYNGETDCSMLGAGIYPVVIYEYIKRNSSLGHPIAISDIEEALEPFCPDAKKSSIKKTIKRNLQTLEIFDKSICIEYEDISHPSFGTIKNIYYDQDLSMTDVQILSDALIYSRHLSKNSKKEIYGKLLAASGLSAKGGNTWVDSVLKDIDEVPSFENRVLYDNLYFINESILNKECLQFSYNYFTKNDTKTVVRKYKGVSPYKIVLENGIYYLVGSTLHSQENLDIYIEKGLAFPVVYLEVNKLGQLSVDDRYPYIDVDNTTAEGWNRQDFTNAGFNPYNRQLNFREFDTNPSLKVSARGLDILIDSFGDRVTAVKTKEKYEGYAGKQSNFSFYYKTIIRHFTVKDFQLLLNLLLRYSVKDIQLLNCKSQLNHVLHIIKKQCDSDESE